MPNYRTLAAIATPQGRVPKGAVVELTKEHAAAFGSDYVVPVKDEVTAEQFGSNEDLSATQTLSGDKVETVQTGDTTGDETTGDDEDLSKKTADELKEIAKSLNLPVSGSKPDLIERITLAKTAENDGENDQDDKNDGE